MKLVIKQYRIIEEDPEDNDYFIMENIETGERQRIKFFDTDTFLTDVLQDEDEE